MPAIVTVNVSQQVAPLPNTLQKFGALISQGATTLTANTSTYLTQYSDLTSILAGAKTISSMTWATNTVTVTTAAPHGFPNADTIWMTIAGVTPAAYNGNFLCTITGASTFTYVLGGSNPGSVTVQGTATDEDVGELVAMATTFFAQGFAQGVYVLELGNGSVTEGVTALTNYLNANPNSQYTPGASNFFYHYMVPRTWDANSAFLTLIASYENTTARTYFWVTTTLQNYALYTNLMKCVIPMIESPAMGVWSSNVLTAQSYSAGVVTFTTTSAHGIAVGQWFQITGSTPTGYNGWWQALPGTTGSTILASSPSAIGASSVLGSVVPSYYANSAVPSTEFSLASALHGALSYSPSTTNRVTPFAFEFIYGVTPFPTKGLSSLLTSLKNANINIVGTGAEGGISSTILLWGTTADGNDFTYWYSVDWLAINADLDVANAVINGSNNPINPLYYNQQGIDRLQGVIAATVSRGVTYGLVLGLPIQTALDGPVLISNLDADAYVGQSVVNAVPFITYSQENPSDYKLGKYSGFSVIYVPARGFTQIVINVLVTQFVAV